MNILESLSRGLRSAGGVLNPAVERQLGQEQIQEDVARRQMAQKMFDQRIAQEREQALAGAVGPALEGGDFAAAARAAIGSGAPGGVNIGMQMLGHDEARKARVQQAKDALEARAAEFTERGRQRLEQIEAQAREGRITRAEADARAAETRRELLAAAAANAQALARVMASLRQPPKPDFVTNDQGVFRVDAQGNATPVRGPDGPLSGKGAAKDKPLTEGQGKNVLYGTRAAQSHKVMLDLEEKISLEGLAATNFPGGNYLRSSEQQRVDQAQRNFVNAVLRQESGAVISDAEFENAKKQYFPQPGDKKDVIEQKRANRMAAIQGFARIAGPGGKEVMDVLNAPLLPVAGNSTRSGTATPPVTPEQPGSDPLGIRNK